MGGIHHCQCTGFLTALLTPVRHQEKWTKCHADGNWPACLQHQWDGTSHASSLSLAKLSCEFLPVRSSSLGNSGVSSCSSAGSSWDTPRHVGSTKLVQGKVSSPNNRTKDPWLEFGCHRRKWRSNRITETISSIWTNSSLDCCL